MLCVWRNYFRNVIEQIMMHAKNCSSWWHSLKHFDESVRRSRTTYTMRLYKTVWPTGKTPRLNSLHWTWVYVTEIIVLILTHFPPGHNTAEKLNWKPITVWFMPRHRQTHLVYQQTSHDVTYLDHFGESSDIVCQSVTYNK